jgi:hypothetical protein
MKTCDSETLSTENSKAKRHLTPPQNLIFTTEQQTIEVKIETTSIQEEGTIIAVFFKSSKKSS